MTNISNDTGRISAAMISVSEARSLSGLDEEVLTALVKSGEIKGRIVNGAWKIYRMSLQSHMGRQLKGDGSTQAMSESGRIGASAVVSRGEETEQDFKDEIWALKKALAEEQIAVRAERAALEAERAAHLHTANQLIAAQQMLDAITAATDSQQSAAAEEVAMESASLAPVAPAKSQNAFVRFLRKLFIG